MESPAAIYGMKKSITENWQVRLDCKTGWTLEWKLVLHFVRCAGDVKHALTLLNQDLQKEEDPAARYEEWRETVAAKMTEFPMWFPQRDDVIIPQFAVKARPLSAASPCISREDWQLEKLSGSVFGLINDQTDCDAPKYFPKSLSTLIETLPLSRSIAGIVAPVTQFLLLQKSVRSLGQVGLSFIPTLKSWVGVA